MCLIAENEIMIKGHTSWFNSDIMRAKLVKKSQERQQHRLCTHERREY